LPQIHFVSAGLENGPSNSTCDLLRGKKKPSMSIQLTEFNVIVGGIGIHPKTLSNVWHFG
jgi:hypothetical protein